MAKKEEIPFEDFRNKVDPNYESFIDSLHKYLLENECKMKVGLTSNGYLVSYSHPPSIKEIANFVFSRKGLIIRIYGDNVNKYLTFMDTLPAGMVNSITRAPVCKRLANPNDCNPKCSMGYDFAINSERFQKCKYNCFMFDVNGENNPYIKSFIENEVKERVVISSILKPLCFLL